MRAVVAVLLVGCASPQATDTALVDETDERPDEVPADDSDSDSDTDVDRDTDTDATGEDSATSETDDGSTDSDDSGDSDTVVVVPPTPPASWGAGFTDISRPLVVDHPFAVDAGDFAAFRSPQDVIVLLVDLDHDGDLELYTSPVPRSLVADRPARVFHWDNGRLFYDAALSTSMSSGWASPIAAADLDGDGYTDLITSDWRVGVRWGRRNGFTDPQPLTDLTNDPGWAGNSGLGLFDVDGDGWLDILHGSTSCGPANVVLHQVAPRTFEPRLAALPTTPSAYAASLGSAILEDGSQLHVMLGDSCGPQRHPGFFRLTRDPALPWPTGLAYDATPATSAWKQMPAFAGAPFTVVAPMGGGFDDLDGDGFLDLVITLGTAPQGLLAGRGNGLFDDQTLVIQVASSPQGAPEFPWAVAFPDLDMDGRPELLWTVGDDATSFMAVRGHLMRSSVYWNGGDWQLFEVSDAIGMGQLGNWRSLALHDPDGDGDADVVIGGFGQLPAVYRNDINLGQRGVSLQLQGTTSNPHGIGARILAEVAGLPDRHTVMGGLGNRWGSTEPMVFLGAALSPVIDRLEILWPSGLRQVLEDVPVGQRLTVTEPATVTVLDADRSAPADGVSTLGVQVTPRQPDGSLDVGASVAVTLHGAPATILAGPTSDGAGTWTMTVQAPVAAGTTWLEVRVDGVPLRAFPRLRWL